MRDHTLELLTWTPSSNDLNFVMTSFSISLARYWSTDWPPPQPTYCSLPASHEPSQNRLPGRISAFVSRHAIPVWCPSPIESYAMLWSTPSRKISFWANGASDACKAWPFKSMLEGGLQRSCRVPFAVNQKTMRFGADPACAALRRGSIASSMGRPIATVPPKIVPLSMARRLIRFTVHLPKSGRPHGGTERHWSA